MKKSIISVAIGIISLVFGGFWFATLFTQAMALSSSEVLYDASTGLFPDEVCSKWILTDTASPENPTISDDKLMISTSGNSENIYYIQTDLVISYPLIIEARVKRLSGSVSRTDKAPIAVFFTVAPQAGNTLYVGDDEIFILNSSGNRADVALVDTNDDFHNYRIEIDSMGGIQVYYDDVLTLSGETFISTSFNGLAERVGWGELSLYANGTSEWELVKHNLGCSEIQVAENATNIPDNSGDVQFGTTMVGNPIIKTFTISNTDQTDLTLTPPITVPVGFSVTSSFGKTILTTGEQTTFTVQLDAVSVGSYSGELIFANNDANENPFNFTISGFVEGVIVGTSTPTPTPTSTATPFPTSTGTPYTPTPTHTPTSTNTPVPTSTPAGNCCCVIVALGGTCGGARTQFIFQTAELIDTYTRFRDETLETSSTGQKYIHLYNENTHELAGILLADSGLRSRTAQFLNNASDEVDSLLLNATSTVTLSQTLYDEANALVQDLAAAGSSEFSTTMMLTWDDLGLEQYIGEETTTIWEEIQSSSIYLPIIVK